MTTPAPICVHCGKRYGHRATHEELIHLEKAGDPLPPYRGNGIVVKEASWANSTTLTYRTTWDGETWRGGYKPFCTLRCALDYARKAYARKGR